MTGSIEAISNRGKRGCSLFLKQVAVFLAAFFFCGQSALPAFGAVREQDQLYYIFMQEFVILETVLAGTGYEKRVGEQPDGTLTYIQKEPLIQLTFDMKTNTAKKNGFTFQLGEKITLIGDKIYIEIGALAAIINKEALVVGNCVIFQDADISAVSFTALNKGLVAHAGGSIDGVFGTNSLEAIIKNYDLGHRVFEVDFNLTTDGRMAATHDWAGLGGAKSAEEFKKIKLHNRYTTLMLEDLLDIMAVNKDMYLITDTKSFEYTDDKIVRQFQEIYDQAAKRGGTLLDRIIPQIYNQKMYGLVKGVYPFKNMIYTLYASPDSDSQVVEFVRDKADIPVITMGPVRYRDQFKADLDAAGKLIYFFTLNNPAEIQGYRGTRAHGFYTDTVTAPQL